MDLPDEPLRSRLLPQIDKAQSPSHAKDMLTDDITVTVFLKSGSERSGRLIDSAAGSAPMDDEYAGFSNRR